MHRGRTAGIHSGLEDRLNHPKEKKAPNLPDAPRLTTFILTVCRAATVYIGSGAASQRHVRSMLLTPSTPMRRSAGLQGTTVLLAIVTPEGKPSAISIQRSLGAGLNGKLRPLGYQLDQRAVEAVSQWKFDPATFQGKPVAVVINVAVNFKLY